MINSDGWKVLTEKVWHQQRQWAMASVMNPANKPDFFRGMYDGLVKAQWSATNSVIEPQDIPEEELIQSFEDKLQYGIHK